MATSTFQFDPPRGENIDIQDVCVWLIRVMNRKDKGLKFVASILAFYLDRGGLSHKQIESLQRIFDRVLDTFDRDQLEVQGSSLASDDGAPTNIVTFSTKRPSA